MPANEPSVLLKEPFKGLKCPSCNADLLMSTRQNIEIDYCPQCRGIWLDRGELDKIIERSTQIVEPVTEAVAVPEGPDETRDMRRDGDDYGHGHPERYSKRTKHGHGRRGGHRRRGGIVDFLGDIFD